MEERPTFLFHLHVSPDKTQVDPCVACISSSNDALRLSKNRLESFNTTFGEKAPVSITFTLLFREGKNVALVCSNILGGSVWASYFQPCSHSYYSKVQGVWDPDEKVNCMQLIPPMEAR